MKNNAIYFKCHAEKALSDFIASFPVILVTGPRQIGTGGLICTATTLGILGKERYSIPVSFL